MSSLAVRLRDRFYANDAHPYRIFERTVAAALRSPQDTLLDAGCGRTVPVLRRFAGRAGRLIGVELVDFTEVPPGIETYKTDLAHLPLPDACVDLIMSRSVFEHLTDPDAVYRELARVLKPGGRIVFLTANLWDYGTMVARLVPNRHHAKVVKTVEGRAEEDTFPTAYRTNTRRDVCRLSAAAGLRVTGFEYLSQYPNYLMFNGVLFFLGMCYEKLIARFDALRLLRGWILVTLEKPAQPQ
ncbi:class I SAM-dependent methyltransferase [Rubrivivax sp. RP6-9]|uniref:class I SAM-dependent methyltransferase n=1 Tax=Rubrivivax sp. RP6-9 TaxID=3415750 RepID=UPI003CC6BB90